MTSPPKRRWPAFRLRTLLILVVVLGCVLTPVAIKLKKAREQKKAMEWVLENGGRVEYDWEDDGKEGPTAPKWIRGLFGDEFFQTVRSVEFLPGAQVSYQAFMRGLEPSYKPVSDLNPLRGLTNLRILLLSETQISDLSPLRRLIKLQVIQIGSTEVSDLSPLIQLTNLHWLGLDETLVSDLSPLQGLTSLERLDLSHTKVTDLLPIKGLTNLRELSLTRTKVSDLSPLHGLSGLQVLHLEWTPATALEVSRLQKALPNCEIFP